MGENRREKETIGKGRPFQLPLPFCQGLSPKEALIGQTMCFSLKENAINKIQFSFGTVGLREEGLAFGLCQTLPKETGRKRVQTPHDLRREQGHIPRGIMESVSCIRPWYSILSALTS